ncbi:hypothetical protein V2G26_009020 [Clonostachys chloroleuca]
MLLARILKEFILLTKLHSQSPNHTSAGKTQRIPLTRMTEEESKNGHNLSLATSLGLMPPSPHDEMHSD